MIEVTLDQAKLHLYIDLEDTSRDVDVADKLQEAKGAVISYLKADADTELGNMPQVRAAILQMLTALFENRGDDGGTLSKFEQGYLPPSVTALLYPLRDPALA